MTCPLCLALLEAGEAQYVSHLLSEHAEAQLTAALSFAALPFLVRGRNAQLVAGFGITMMAILFVRNSFR
jgi:hypothetical protein